MHPTMVEDLDGLWASRALTVKALSGLADEQLEVRVPWHGRQVDVRHLLLRLSESDDELRVGYSLALEAARWHQPEAARILGGRLGCVRGLLVGLPDEVFHRKPSPTDWSAGQVVDHLRLVEERYRIQTEHAIRRLEEPDLPIRVPDDQLPPIPPEPTSAATVDEALDSLEITAYVVNARICWLEGAKLAAPTIWAGWDVDVRFRLYRFRTHARQHAVHLAKTLQAVGWRQTEAQMILAMAEESLAALEGALLGYDPTETFAQAPEGHPSLDGLLRQALADEEALRAIATAGGR